MKHPAINSMYLAIIRSRIRFHIALNGYLRFVLTFGVCNSFLEERVNHNGSEKFILRTLDLTDLIVDEPPFSPSFGFEVFFFFFILLFIFSFTSGLHSRC
jgi:hypothetical protein